MTAGELVYLFLLKQFNEFNTFIFHLCINMYIRKCLDGMDSLRVTNRLTGPGSDEDQDRVSQEHLSTEIISLHRMELKWYKTVLGDWGQCNKEDEEVLQRGSMMYNRWLHWDLLPLWWLSSWKAPISAFLITMFLLRAMNGCIYNLDYQ